MLERTHRGAAHYNNAVCGPDKSWYSRTGYHNHCSTGLLAESIKENCCLQINYCNLNFNTHLTRTILGAVRRNRTGRRRGLMHSHMPI